MSTLPPTTNTSPVGTPVFCFDCAQSGQIVRTQALGFDYAPVVQVTDGTFRMFCGSNRRNYCQHIPLFVQTMGEIGDTEAAIEAFKTLWVTKSDRETNRQTYFDGLSAARLTGNQQTIRDYIDSVRVQLESV
jgi:hypothetical protein